MGAITGRSDTDAALDASASLEQLLDRRLGASGRGLHEKVSSVEHLLAASVVSKLRYIATIRNKVVHERARIDALPRFESTARELIEFLSRGDAQQATSAPGQASSRHAKREWLTVNWGIIFILVSCCAGAYGGERLGGFEFAFGGAFVAAACAFWIIDRIWIIISFAIFCIVCLIIAGIAHFWIG